MLKLGLKARLFNRIKPLYTMNNFNKRLFFKSQSSRDFTVQFDSDGEEYEEVEVFQFKIIDFFGTVYEWKGYEGQTLMDAGTNSGVKFERAWGGNAEWTTWHWYLPLNVRQHQDYVEEQEKEIDAIEFAEGATEESRLACWVKLTKNAFENSEIQLIYVDSKQY